MRIIFTFIFYHLVTLTFGQVIFNKTYVKPDWDYASAVIERNDGRYLIAGSSRSNSQTDYDVNILLIDSLGDIIWDKYLGINDTLEFAYTLIETYDNNYLLSGNSNNAPYLIKFDSNGILIWERKYDNFGSTNSAISVGETLDSNYYFVRPDNSSTLFKVNTIGDTIWTKTYNSFFCNEVIQTSDSGYALIGNNNSFNLEAILIKTDQFGDIIWAKNYNHYANYNVDGVSLKQLADEGFIIATNLELIDINELYLIRTNSVGDTLWTKTNYGIGKPEFIQKTDFDGGYVLSSTTILYGQFSWEDEYRIFISKLDSLGNGICSRYFDGYTESNGNNIAETSDGGFLLTGHKYYPNPTNSTDIILIKTDSLNNCILSTQNLFVRNQSEISTYPNPTNNIINFTINSTDNRTIKQLKISNLLGQEIKLIDISHERTVSINVNDLSNGIYIYQISTTNNNVSYGNFIIRR